MSGKRAGSGRTADQASLADAGAGRFLLSGTVTMATAPDLRVAGLRAFAAHDGDIEIDLGSVERVDSASLALLIDWLAWAQAAGRTLRITALPPAMLALARLSDVDSFLGPGAAAR